MSSDRLGSILEAFEAAKSYFGKFGITLAPTLRVAPHESTGGIGVGAHNTTHNATSLELAELRGLLAWFLSNRGHNIIFLKV